MMQKTTVGTEQGVGINAKTHELAGIVERALVTTPRGAMRIEDLRPGNRIISRSHGAVPLLRIEKQSLVTRGIYVFAGSIGHHRSDRDTLLPFGQPVMVRDWRAWALFGKSEVVVPAWRLIDGEHVRDLGFMAMTVYRLFSHGPEVIYADGMELGTADALHTPDYGV
jgi:hypothetical protein